MNILCETDRLMIRQFELSDTEFIVRLLNEPAFIRYIADKKVRSQDDAVHYLKQGPMASYERYGFGLNLVCLKSSLIPIGICGVLKRDELEYPDLGYAFLEAFCGQGYAREAAQQTLKVTVDSFSLETVFAVTLPDNVRSNQLLEKIGFRFKATVPLYGVCNNLYQYQVKPLPKGAASGLA